MNTKTEFLNPILGEFPSNKLNQEVKSVAIEQSNCVSAKTNFVSAQSTKDALMVLNYGAMPLGGFFKVKTLKHALFLSERSNLNKDELSHLAIKKDSVVQDWFISEPILDDAVTRVSNEIINFADNSGIKLQGIEIKEAYKDHPYKEIEIEIKVTKDLAFDDLDEFWDNAGKEVSKIIDINWDNDRAIEIKNAC